MTGAMSMGANPLRGEAEIIIAGRAHLLRPTFQALVLAEEELGPLFALVERASAGQLRLSEMAALFHHALAPPHEVSREEVGGALMEMGLAGAAAPLKAILSQILRGQSLVASE